MSYQEDEQVRTKRCSSNHAIALAMQGRWKEAVAVNKDILERFPHDVDALNRLGRAHMELVEYSLAREAYNRTVKLDPYNTIARKNLQRLSQLHEVPISFIGDFHKAEPEHFIEETGRAGVVSLYDLAPKEILARMVAGDKVYFRVDGVNLIAKNSREEYLGRVERKPGRRLVKFMGEGNQYSAAIVSSSEEEVTIIIREVYQTPSLAGRLSFPPKYSTRMHPHVNERIPRHELANEEEAVEERNLTHQEVESESILERANNKDNKSTGFKR